MVVGLAFYSAGAALVGAVWLCVKYLSPRGPKRGRSMSFSSKAMVDGAFPPTCEVPPPIINVVLMFEKCPDEEVVISNCKNFMQFERSRSTPVKKGSDWFFVETDIVWNQHVLAIEVSSESELLQKVDEIIKQDLTSYGTRPLWTMTRIINTGSGVSAILARIHHVIGDGIALVESMKDMFSDETGAPLRVELPERPRDVAARESQITVMGRLLKGVFEVVTLAATPYDSDTVFTSPTKKRITTSPKDHKTVIFPTLQLDFVKELKNKANVTVNDLYMAALTGAIRKYCAHRGDPLASTQRAPLRCRALLPVAFPRTPAELADKSRCLRNKWSFVSAAMPLSVSSSAEARLRACNETTKLIKKSPTALVQLWFQDKILCRLPRFFVRQTAFDVFSRHSVVVSNVPGPAKAVHYNGKNKLIGVQFIFLNLLPQFDVMSYNGAVFANINVDVTVVKDPESLAQFFLEEIKELAVAHKVSTDAMMAPMSAGGVFGVASLN